jgi:L-lactate dehydrogenase complex protein LldG
MTENDRIERFMEKAAAASAKVVRAGGWNEALDYAVQACVEKEACQILATGCEQPLSEKASDLCQLKEADKIIAAPNLEAGLLEELTERCRAQNVSLIDRGLREHLGGIDIGLTLADAGIAETGTLVQDSSSEDLRLATMISEIHVAFLKQSSIVNTSSDVAAWLEERFGSGVNFSAFITGPSRTADIERVLTLGVHGPLEVHIVLLTDF